MSLDTISPLLFLIMTRKSDPKHLISSIMEVFPHLNQPRNIRSVITFCLREMSRMKQLQPEQRWIFSFCRSFLSPLSASSAVLIVSILGLSAPSVCVCVRSGGMGLIFLACWETEKVGATQGHEVC